MKKWKILLLCAVLMLLVGCSTESAEQQTAEEYEVYFLQSELRDAAGEGALQTQMVQLSEKETASLQQKATALLQRLIETPEDPTLKSVIPAGTTLLSVNIENSDAVVDLSAAYGTLSGVELTLADCAVTMTLTQLPEIFTVRITVNGEDLSYRGKQIFYRRDVLLAPEGDVVGTVDVTLFFLNADDSLVGERRTLELYEGTTQVAAVTRALENGPESKDLLPVFPEGFRIRSVWLEGDVCYVNLLSAMLDTFPDTPHLTATIRSLGRSLCSLEAVSEVRFLVDGEFTDQYGPARIANSYVT